MRKEKLSYYTDQDILTKYHKEQDDEWLGILLEKYLHLIFGLCMKYFKNEAAAKDHTQQVCLKVIQTFQQKQQDITFFKSWLYQVTKNHCLMHLRKEKHRTISLENAPQPVEDELFSKSYFEKKEQQYQLLERALTTLNEAQQTCIRLFYYKRKSYQEIADEEGYSLKEVKSFLQNGRRNIKVFMERKDNEQA